MNKNALVTLLIVIVLVVAGWMFFGGKMGSNFGLGGVKLSGEYQAVFLSNGQVYFGKVSDFASETVSVTDIYYLRVQQPVKPDPKAGTTNTNNAETQIQLVKLGDELHGPEDKMLINRRHILFIEDLKADGQVVEAIKEHKKNPNGNSSKTDDNTKTNNTNNAQNNNTNDSNNSGN